MNKYTQDILAAMVENLESGKFSDVILSVDGKDFKAHRNILSARSPVFAAMFSHENTKEAQEGRVVIEDVPREEFEAFLRYLYTVTLPAKKLVNEYMLMLADMVCLNQLMHLKHISFLTFLLQYQVESLKTICVDILAESIAVATVVDVLLLADKYRASSLKSKCINYIVANARDVTHTNAWEDMANLNPMLNVEVVRKITSYTPKAATAGITLPW